ncbi:sensor histidine kinase [Methylocystis suflitae]|uniref:sensor histidine kinase n=1 Tax=Methylocystis suflitae TaxID=2951405 RepID=UPI00210BCD06|nr:HAMP domain-containing sensor histidine kinase [Methylocystis suflitae]MCQ4189503.1 HAMP domain-containing histidine kinase [Methylocystis suflitae]
MSSIAEDSHYPSCVDAALHERVAGRPVDEARHRAFIIARLVVAACVLLSAPLILFFHGAPTTSDCILFLLAQIPLASVIVLSRTGDLRLARSLSISGWLAMATAIHALMPGFDAFSVALLLVALVEAALMPDVSAIIIIEVVAIAALALTAGLNLRAPRELLTEHVTTTILLGAPLFLYIAALVFGAVRVERARVRAEARNDRDLMLLTGAVGDILLRLDRAGFVNAVLGDGRHVFDLKRDLIGREFFQRIHVADRPSFLKAVSDAIDGKVMATAAVRVQVGVARNASSEFVAPVFNSFEARVRRAQSNGEECAAEAVLCALRDVNATLEADIALAAAHAAAERAATSNVRLLANVSHELRTPLNAIIGFSQMLATDEIAPSEPAKQREYASIISDSGHHLLEIVNSILDMSKIESGAMQIALESFALRTLADQCCDMMQLQADQSGVTLAREYAEAPGEIAGDKRGCRQIMINLLSNAVKFTPRGGTVKLLLQAEGNHLVITVADDGEGIAAGDLARLGDPFFQARASLERGHEGTGLGLSVVRGLVGLHGGSITIESGLQAGTTVSVRLPLDCRNSGATGGPARIATIARLSAPPSAAVAVGLEPATVKKIA